ncbi:uncharacterized protein [Elaeis guineensis]|uniref:uncharacterized protein n=1 Tax=Elaeis guineensis var. tenera TaxID=51953 RepID=UPI00094FCE7B
MSGFSDGQKTSRCHSAPLLPSTSPRTRPSPNLMPGTSPGGSESHGSGFERCSSSRTPSPGSAFAEALNELIGSAVVEILHVIGQWQAEQQKQVQYFQMRNRGFIVNTVIMKKS